MIIFFFVSLIAFLMSLATFAIALERELFGATVFGLITTILFGAFAFISGLCVLFCKT